MIAASWPEGLPLPQFLAAEDLSKNFLLLANLRPENAKFGAQNLHFQAKVKF